MRRILSVGIVLVLAGIVAAGEYTGLITSVSKDEIKITVREKGKKGKGEEKTLKVAKDAKFSKKGKEEDTEVSVDDITKMIEGAKGKVKGVMGKVTTDGEGDSEKVTKIVFGGGKRPGK